MNRSRRHWTAFALCGLVAFALAAGTRADDAVEAPVKPNGNLSLTDEARLKQATRLILCPCGCAPTLVDECICGTARRLKDEMKAKYLAGTTPQELVAEFTDEYGEQYLGAPPKEGFNMVIWLFPALAFVGLSIVFWYVLQRLTRRAETVPSEPQQDDADQEVDRYKEEIERAVADRAGPSK